MSKVKYKNNKKSRLIKIILLLIIVLIILLISLITILNKTKSKQTIVEEEVVIRGLDNEYPNGTFAFSKKYNGKFEMNEISTTVSKFMTSSIPTLRNLVIKYNDTKLEEYYDSNIETVRKLFGRITKTEFMELVKLVRTLNSDKLVYKTSEYNTDSFKFNEDKYYIEINIEYNDETPIKVIMRVDEIYKKISFVSAD